MSNIPGMMTPDQLEDKPGQVVEDNFESGTNPAAGETSGMFDISKQEAPADEPVGQADDDSDGEGEKLYAGKYKSVEELERAYEESQKLISRKGQKPDDEKPAEGEGEDEGGEGDESADKGNESDDGDESKPAIDFEALGAEFTENGELSDESYESLEKAGVSRDIADTYVEGVKAIQTVRLGEINKVAGGEEEMANIVKWGSANLGEEEQAAFNEAMQKAFVEGDMSSARLMVAAVKAQMGGNEPRYLNGDTANGQPGPKPFGNRAEITEAMRNPKYQSDPRYNKEVQERLRVTEWA